MKAIKWEYIVVESIPYWLQLKQRLSHQLFDYHRSLQTIRQSLYRMWRRDCSPRGSDWKRKHRCQIKSPLWKMSHTAGQVKALIFLLINQHVIIHPSGGGRRWCSTQKPSRCEVPALTAAPSVRIISEIIQNYWKFSKVGNSWEKMRN